MYQMLLQKRWRYAMVCVQEEEAICVVVDPRPDAQQRRFSVKVRAHNTVADLYAHVRLQTVYPEFELVFPAKDSCGEVSEVFFI